MDIRKKENKILHISVWFKNACAPRKYEAMETYEEGSFFCIRTDRQITKYPVADIFMITEDSEEEHNLNVAKEFMKQYEYNKKNR